MNPIPVNERLIRNQARIRRALRDWRCYQWVVSRWVPIGPAAYVEIRQFVRMAAKQGWELESGPVVMRRRVK